MNVGVERLLLSNDGITISFLVGFLMIFLMKLYKPSELVGYISAFFTQGFVEKRSEEGFSELNPFNLVLQLFSVLVISLLLYFLMFSNTFGENMVTLLSVLGIVFVFFLLKGGLILLLYKLFDFNDAVRYFINTKNAYLNTVCLLIFPFLILYQFTLKHHLTLLIALCFLLVFRLFLILRNNKNIITQELFYFILYFCALEIAPILILYRTTEF